MLSEYRGYLAIAMALVATLTLTPAVRWLARRWGMVSRPRSDRWAKKPTALLGGIAIFGGVALTYLVVLSPVAGGWVVFGGSAFVFAVGLVDDLRELKPYQKLIAQLLAATLVVLGGLTLPWTGSALVNVALTLFWLVGITNALNMLDNMDGLAAGVAAIAAAFLSAGFFTNGQQAEGFLLGAFSAALVGFLVFNFNPASIFMGDCGSMFVGFFLGSAALLNFTAGGRSRNLVAVLAVPVLTLCIPIFDTTLVTVVRKLAGRRATQGGRDHTSHRLVALGLTERRAVCLLYGLAVLSGLLAVCVRHLAADVSLGLIVVFSVLLTLLGIHLARVQVYREGDCSKGSKPLVAFLVNVSYKRRVFEVLLDVVLISLAYYLANLLTFGSLDSQPLRALVVQSLPVLVGLKLAVFLVMGVYRGLVALPQPERPARVREGRRGEFGGRACWRLLLLFRFDGFSRVVFVLDGLLVLLLVGGSRLAFRLLRWLLPENGGTVRRRALIYGAGDAGELLLREMRNNAALRCLPVGFADDDPLKTGKVMHGLRVFGGNGSLPNICREQAVDEVYISERARFSEERVREIAEHCRTTPGVRAAADAYGHPSPSGAAAGRDPGSPKTEQIAASPTREARTSG